jgi:hypothetical protein
MAFGHTGFTALMFISTRITTNTDKYCTQSEFDIKGKGKAIPLQAWTGPEGSRKLQLPYFKKIGT